MLDVPVRALAFSPAGDLAVASGSDVHLVAGERVVKVGLGDEVTGVAFRDARTLAVASKERLSIIELGGKPRITRIEHACTWHTMVWSSDGKYIAGGQYEPFVDIIDVEARRELRVLDPDEFDDEGRTAVLFVNATLVTTAYNKLVRWRFADVIAGKAKCRMPKTGVTGHAHLFEIVPLADGSLMALVDSEDKSTLQRFAPTGEKMGKQQPIDRAFRLAVSGDELVLAGETTWLAALDGTTLCTLDETLPDPQALAVLGDRIAIGGERGLRVVSRQ